MIPAQPLDNENNTLNLAKKEMWHNSAIILRPIERISKSLQHIRKRKHSLSGYQAEPHNGAFFFFFHIIGHSRNAGCIPIVISSIWNEVLWTFCFTHLLFVCFFFFPSPLAATMLEHGDGAHAGITFSPCLPNVLPRVIPPTWPWLNKFVSRQPQPPCLTLSCPSNKAGMCLIKHRQWCERVREREVEMVCGGSH